MEQKVKKVSITRIGRALMWILFVSASFVVVVNEAFYWSVDDYEQHDDLLAGDEDSRGDCNVQGVLLRGELVTYVPPENIDGETVLGDQTSSDDIVFAIQSADEDDSIKAILLEIDSHGGGPVAAEEVENALKISRKPTVAYIREYGTSAAYWAATGADLIIASANSDVGGIGVTSSYLDYSRQNQQEGIQFVQISSGKYKDAGVPDRALTEDERRLLQRDVDILHENFILTVATNREIDVETVRQLADGSSMLGKMALESGLIDKLGGLDEAKSYLKEKTGEEPVICWY